MTQDFVSSVDQSGGIMDRGRQGISEFFLRHRYNYICEALGLHNPSAPYRSMHDCLAVPGDFWKDLHKSPNQKLYEEQDEQILGRTPILNMVCLLLQSMIKKPFLHSIQRCRIFERRRLCFDQARRRKSDRALRIMQFVWVTKNLHNE